MKQHGVTLLELLIVIALMAVVAGIVIPMFGGPVPTSELRASARQLAAGLRLARSEAVSERRETFLLLDVAGKVKKSWGRKGPKPGQFEMPHMLALDSAGNLYVAEVNGQRLQKFVRN